MRSLILTILALSLSSFATAQNSKPGAKCDGVIKVMEGEHQNNPYRLSTLKDSRDYYKTSYRGTDLERALTFLDGVCDIARSEGNQSDTIVPDVADGYNRYGSHAVAFKNENDILNTYKDLVSGKLVYYRDVKQVRQTGNRVTYQAGDTTLGKAVREVIRRHHSDDSNKDTYMSEHDIDSLASTIQTGECIGRNHEDNGTEVSVRRVSSSAPDQTSFCSRVILRTLMGN